MKFLRILIFDIQQHFNHKISFVFKILNATQFNCMKHFDFFRFYKKIKTKFKPDFNFLNVNYTFKKIENRLT